MAIKIGRLAALLLIAGMLTSPTDLSSCGPFLLSAIFSFSTRPDNPDAGFSRGQLGILLPNYDRLYLIVAYRYLMGESLSPEARKAIFPPPPAKPGPASRWVNEWSVSIPPSVDEWLTARQSLSGAGSSPKIDVNRQLSTPSSYDEYLNCPDDAFHNAASALHARASKYGAANADVRDWLHAQDQVFSNCSGTSSIPQPAPSPALWLQQDRAYQIAAANFYAGRIDDAEAGFKKIAADTKSPWRALSAYLIARCEIRKSTIGNQPEAIRQAQSELESILKDDTLKSVQPAAARLLNFVRARVDPDQRLQILSAALSARNTSPAFAQDLTDYLFLLRKSAEPTDDLTDWISQWNGPSGDNRLALERWHAKKTLPWLLAALSRTHGNDVAAAELLQAAGELKPDSPANATAEFHSIRLLEESNQDQLARTRLDGLLAARAKLPPSSRNLFLAERMRASESWDAFLKSAPRAPIGYGFAGYDTESPANFVNNPQLRAFAGGRQVFDTDSTIVLNRSFPIRMLKDAAASQLLPATLRSDIAQAAWVRSILIGGENATTDAKFSAILQILKNPGMRPFVEPGFGRLTPMAKIDNYRDNWWCSAAPSTPDSGYDYRRARAQLKQPLTLLYGADEPEAPFLSDADRTQASEEWSKLSALRSAPSYLADQVVGYVKAHPEDPRAPEALFLAVRATRYGCTDEETGKNSEAAYQLLHDRYPKSEWAAKTKYWYR